MQWCMWRHTVHEHIGMCQHARAYTDKYGHTWEDTKGQRVKIPHPCSDVDVKAAGSNDGLGNLWKVLQSFGRVDFGHHWIVMKSAETNSPDMTEICQDCSEQCVGQQQPTETSPSHLWSWNDFLCFGKSLNPSDWTGLDVAAANDPQNAEKHKHCNAETHSCLRVESLVLHYSCCAEAQLAETGGRDEQGSATLAFDTWRCLREEKIEEPAGCPSKNFENKNLAGGAGHHLNFCFSAGQCKYSGLKEDSRSCWPSLGMENIRQVLHKAEKVK